MSSTIFLLVLMFYGSVTANCSVKMSLHAGDSDIEPPSECDTFAEQLRGTHDPTRFGRMLAELDINAIAARSL